MSAPVKAGDEILIPLFEPGPDLKVATVKWSQNLSERTGQYYGLTADNITTGEQVAFYIAAEFYKSSTINNPNHITKVGQLLEGEGYKLKVDDRLQYGQVNGEGLGRFIVYHNKDNKPYQHRFVETTLASASAKKGADLAAAMGFGAVAGSASDIAKKFVGDYLHTF